MKNDASSYIALARSIPALDQDREVELLQRMRYQGDRLAANAIARAYQRPVVGLALKFRHYGTSLSDLIAEGNMGLLRALEKFELDRGVRFGTYAAYWIRAHMLAHVVKSRNTVGGSAGPLRTQMYFKLRRERARVTCQFGTGEVAEKILAERLGLSVERLQAMTYRLDHRDVSLEATSGEAEASVLEHLAADSNQEEELQKRQLEQQLEHTMRQALGVLDARELLIIQRRIMASGADVQSLAELARGLGISRERARQLQERAKRKLRRSLRAAAPSLVRAWGFDESTDSGELDGNAKLSESAA